MFGNKNVEHEIDHVPLRQKEDCSLCGAAIELASISLECSHLFSIYLCALLRDTSVMALDGKHSPVQTCFTNC